MLRLTSDELAARLSLPLGVAGLCDEQLIVVEGAVAETVRSMLAGVPVVVAGTGPGVDVELVGEETMGRIAAVVEQHAEAAVALAVLLRSVDNRPVAEGLAAESAVYSLLQAGPDHRRWLEGRVRRDRPAEEEPPVHVRREGNRLHLTLNRPGVRNAFSAAMRDALVDALAVAADPAVDVLIDGAGPSFCSGGDLDEFGTTPDPATAHLIRLRRSAGRAIAAAADRVTVRVHGTCVGAGVELAAFAGQVVAHPDATFRLPEVGMGLIPGAGGTVSIPPRIGRHRTMLLALTGEPIDASTALAWGLVDEISG